MWKGLIRFTKVYNDIALVKLEQRVYFNSIIRPACLWDTESSNSTMYIATGFCNNEMAGTTSTGLIKLVLGELPQDHCAQRNRFASRFSVGATDGQLCIDSNTEGRHACLGDPGSSLLTLTQPSNCMYHVVGITSLGPYGCGAGKSRALYTKVSHYLNWIEENVWGSKADLKDAYKSLKYVSK